MNFESVFTPIHSGHLTVRLAENQAEVTAAQHLRYRVFCEEMGGRATPEVQAQRRDFDRYDDICHHLLVLDNTHSGEDKVVGTYRLITRPQAEKVGQFYTESEYNVSKVKAFAGEVLELGRSCVAQPYRTRPVIQLLWHGIGAFIATKDIKLMFGCASFHGINYKEHAHALAYLYHYHLAPENVRPRALPEFYVDMNMMPKEEVVPRAAIASLPPLIKGYIRLNSMIGDGAVQDFAYNTTDVSIVVLTEHVKAAYMQRYVPSAE